MSEDLSSTLEALAVATQVSVEAASKEVRLALRVMALATRQEHPTARYLVLDDSDQGETADWVAVEDADGTTLVEWPGDDWAFLGGEQPAWHLYDTHREVALPFMKDDQELRKHTVWQNVRIDIDKVLSA